MAGRVGMIGMAKIPGMTGMAIPGMTRITEMANIAGKTGPSDQSCKYVLHEEFIHRFIVALRYVLQVYLWDKTWLIQQMHYLK